MVDFKGYFERATRRLSGDSHLLQVLLQALGGRKGILRKDGLTLRKVFEDGDLMGKLRDALEKAKDTTELTRDEEHGLWEIETVTLSGVHPVLDWSLASYVEFQMAVELFK